MRVDPRLAVLPGAAAQRRAAAGGAFSVAGGADAKGTAGGASAAAPLATLDAILALQGESGDPAERRRRSARQGHDILDALDRLKAALLAGRVSAGDLKAVADRLAARMGPSGDPRLDEILAHVALRAEVEVAKLKRAQAEVAGSPPP